VATPGALAALEEAGQTPIDVLCGHSVGDWGDLDEHDRQENEFSLRRGFRLLSAYTLNNGTRIWIITEAGRSATTLLLPSEYGSRLATKKNDAPPGTGFAGYASRPSRQPFDRIGDSQIPLTRRNFQVDTANLLKSVEPSGLGGT